jgi:hypothetical protein
MGGRLSEEHRRRFLRLAERMNTLLREIRAYCPEANLYVEDSGNWHILSGDSHEGDDPCRDRSMARADVWHSSGGAW